MQNNHEQEIGSEQTIREIEQRDLPEFEHKTEHPEQDDTRVKSEQIRYENADSLYE